MRVARWEDWSGRGLEHLVLTERATAIVAVAVCIVADQPPYAVRYRVECDAEWRCREVDVEIVDSGRTVRLRGDGRGRWTDGEGARLPHLDGAIDVDLSITPFTNTLSIRRLDLAAGDAREIAVVYVRAPALRVDLDHQRYICVEPRRRYRYEAVDGTFAADIEVDADGLVLTYPGLFRRRG
ncbi:MAG TPA: putative glycolipid-binding domain-containing protein [Methylomirabilota bacterium]|nr:putative glycolipid-binding domain-containing protein [Methylomirabilota bacterium]